MNEAETRAELIDPALKAAGWGVTKGSRIRREVIAPGRLIGHGKRTPAEYADYVLVYHGQKLAVIEAKKRDLKDTEGVGQAKNYAKKLETRFAYSTNGIGIYQIDMQTGQESNIDHYPTPETLWDSTFKNKNEWRDRFAAIPFEDCSGTWEARYYQHNAIQHVLEAIAHGQDRILLTMATGTGKTPVAFQIAWKLFQSRWSLTRKPTRRPRILFLADRNILANQAFNKFSAFPEDALIRIDPKGIKKRNRVPKNGSVFFTIFQTFMAKTADTSAAVSDSAQSANTSTQSQPNTATNNERAERSRSPEPSNNPIQYNFGDYSPDFFDFIIIDECHRGGAKDESSWRKILEYFSPAVQLGLTATPKRKHNADTYDYFGKPVYTYALKTGINDGYLTPFKVRQIDTTLDEYQFSADDDLVEGDIDEDKIYTESDFNRIIEMKEREQYRVQLFMAEINQTEKTLVFCANQDHALVVRDLINQMKISTDPNYCVRVTANDGKIGEQHLANFQDNEKTIPTILTTSQKLSTGVDAKNVRNIVLMRPIGTMIEFKQIVGRGTRLFEGKDYFTIYDFVEAYKHFNDKEWDGEPQAPAPPQPRRVSEKEGAYNTDGQANISPQDSNETSRPKRIRIKLADGKERTIQHHIQTSFWSPDGTPMTAAAFVEQLFGDIPELFKNEVELRSLWSRPDTRASLLEGMAEKGYGDEQLTEIGRLIDADNSDPYDVLAYIAYATEPISRQERVSLNQAQIFCNQSPQQQEFLAFVLDQYVKEGVGELDRAKLPRLLELKYSAIKNAIHELGPVAQIGTVFVEFQKYLYSDSRAA